MEQLSQMFLQFIDSYGYIAVAVLMAMENACIPVPSELILGFAGYLIFAGQMTFTGAMIAGMVGGMLGSIFAYAVGSTGGRAFVDKYGKYFLIKKSHVDLAQDWFDKYGIRAVFFSRMLPVVRTFISLPAGFARVNFSAFLFYTFAGVNFVRRYNFGRKLEIFIGNWTRGKHWICYNLRDNFSCLVLKKTPQKMKKATFSVGGIKNLKLKKTKRRIDAIF